MTRTRSPRFAAVGKRISITPTSPPSATPMPSPSRTELPRGTQRAPAVARSEPQRYRAKRFRKVSTLKQALGGLKRTMRHRLPA